MRGDEFFERKGEGWVNENGLWGIKGGGRKNESGG